MARRLLVAGALLSSYPRGVPGAVPLDAQRCNTVCQSEYTDCIDRCDHVRPCEATCDRVVRECVQRCTDSEPPAPPKQSP